MRAQRILVSVAAVMAASGCGGRTRASQASPSPGAAALIQDIDSAPSPGAPGSFAAEVAAVDVANQRITLRNPSASGAGVSAGEKTVPVAQVAQSALAKLQPGDQVVVACDDGAGNLVTSGAGWSAGATASAAASRGASPSAATRRRAYGPAGSDLGIGATDGSSLFNCPRIVSLMRVAKARS
jgi:hypothetical protein